MLALREAQEGEKAKPSGALRPDHSSHRSDLPITASADESTERAEAALETGREVEGYLGAPAQGRARPAACRDSSAVARHRKASQHRAARTREQDSLHDGPSQSEP